MPRSAYRDRLFPPAEVRRILRQAAELHEAAPAPGDGGRGHTLEEIERIARDAGISAAALRRAVAGEVASPAPRSRFSLLPAPGMISVERTGRGAVDASNHEELARAIRGAAGVLGDARPAGDALRWSNAATGGRRLHAIVEPAGNERVTVRVEENLQAARASIFSGTLAMTLLFFLPILALLAPSSPGAVPAILFAWPLVAYVAAWLHYGRRFARRERELRALVADVVAVAGARTGRRERVVEEEAEGRARIGSEEEAVGREREEGAADPRARRGGA